MALASVFTIASWPISSTTVCGRYLRASTRYGDALTGFSGCSGISSPRPGDSASSIAKDLGAARGECEAPLIGAERRHTMVLTQAYRRSPHKGGFATGALPLYSYVKRASVQRIAGFV